MTSPPFSAQILPRSGERDKVTGTGGERMEIIIRGEPKEIAALVREIQERRAEKILEIIQDRKESRQIFL